MLKTHRVPNFKTCLFLLLILPSMASASTVDNLLSQINLPNENWEFIDNGPQAKKKTLVPKESRQSINLQVMANGVPSSANVFIGLVAKDISRRSGYEKAEIGKIKTEEINGVKWDTFQVTRKDGIRQEIWGKKLGEIVLVYIYTGKGKPFNQYRPDVISLLKQAPK